MRTVQNFFIQGLPFFFPVLLYLLLASDASALQGGGVVIDGRVTIAVEVARTAQEQARGLGGRSSLPRGGGMLFLFDAVERRTFWMKGMLIPLDILWIREGKVVAIDANVAPPRSREAPAKLPQRLQRAVGETVVDPLAALLGDDHAHVAQYAHVV